MQQADKKHRYARKLTFAGLSIATLLTACKPQTAAAPTTTVRPAESHCGEHGQLQASLTGSIEAQVDWSPAAMRCESMLRPKRAGVRLRFSGEVANERLAIIIAMPDLVPGDAGKELPSNVTITVEGSGRFFGTPDLNSCWTDVREQRRLSADEERYAISGTLYCVAPLGELNRDAAVSIAQLSFSSVVDWSLK